ncbi:MFS transporter [Nocardioides insulae]|uniref:MFS transporter n=1 Tax=Nocardioides insulae TaxID=394734 RepID=UPI001FE0E5EA|nr:MFS transporter [Nocardioides insulae]
MAGAPKRTGRTGIPEPGGVASHAPGGAGTPTAETGLIAAVGWSYFPLAFLARLPYAMMVVGVLTLVVSGRDSLALGGLTSAAVGVGAAAMGPFLGAAADRFGQRAAVLVAGCGNALALLLIAWAVYAPVPDAAVLAAALLVGATAPQVGPMSRSRLVGAILRTVPVLRRETAMNRTMAYESAVDEVTFVVGPVVVGVLAALVSPAAPVIAAAGVTLVFVTAFALHPSVHQSLGHAAGEVAPAPARDLFRAPVVVVVLGVLGIGLFFGASLTAVTSFMEDAGHAEEAGLVYGALGLGSAVLALAAMLFPERFRLTARWLVFGVVMLLGAGVLAASNSISMLLLGLLIAGVGIGPTLVTLFSLGAQRSPRGRNATVMTILGSAIIVGQSAASAINGRIGEGLGTGAALLLPAVAATVVVAAGLTNAVLVRRSGPAR